MCAERVKVVAIESKRRGFIMKCTICDGLGILPGLTKNTKCSYCDWGDVSDEDIDELSSKAALYDKLNKEATDQGYSCIGNLIDSAKEWKEIAEIQAQNTLDLQEKIKDDLVVFGWAWFEVFMDQVVNDGISYGPRKPELDSNVEGVSFLYLELYAKKESLIDIEWKWT